MKVFFPLPALSLLSLSSKVVSLSVQCVQFHDTLFLYNTNKGVCVCIICIYRETDMYIRYGTQNISCRKFNLRLRFLWLPCVVPGSQGFMRHHPEGPLGLPPRWLLLGCPCSLLTSSFPEILDKTCAGGKDSECAKVMVEKTGRKQHLLYKWAFYLDVYILFLERQK